MSRFQEVARAQAIVEIDRHMTTASKHLANFSAVVQLVRSNWQAYAATSPPSDELQATGIEFAERGRTLVDAGKTGLAHALDVIAAGMVDSEGQPLSRADLLAELADVPAEAE